MGRSILLAAVALLLLVLNGTEASRPHPASKETVPMLQAAPNSTTERLTDAVLPEAESGTPMSYFAYHYAATWPDGYYGFIATMDVYGFPLTKEQGSAAAVWIHDEGDGSLSNLRAIMIGWDVMPGEYGDSKTHFYTKWTNDGFLTTGCINMRCHGFQPKNGASITPGDVIDHVTFPKQLIKRNLNLKVIKDGSSGDWLVYCGLDRAPDLIGRFPRSLFTGGFADRAVSIGFGGVVTAPIQNPPAMGSGYLPTDAKSAASISNIQLVDKDGKVWPVNEDLPSSETKPDAYVVTPIVNGKFYYGGHQQP